MLVDFLCVEKRRHLISPVKINSNRYQSDRVNGEILYSFVEITHLER